MEDSSRRTGRRRTGCRRTENPRSRAKTIYRPKKDAGVTAYIMCIESCSQLTG